MPPDTLINEVLREFGQLVGQRSKVEDTFWESVWEIESLMKPPHTWTSSDLTVTDAGTHGEIDLSALADIIDVISVFNGSYRLGRLFPNSIRNQPSWLQTATLYAYDPTAKKILINKGTSALPPQLTVVYSARTGQVASSTDLPWLSNLYSQILTLMRLRIAEATGATDKIQEILASQTSVMFARSRA